MLTKRMTAGLSLVKNCRIILKTGETIVQSDLNKGTIDMPTQREWVRKLEMNEGREITNGSFEDLAAAANNGDDIRCYTTFDYGEHMASPGSDVGWVEEMMNFGVIYLLEGSRIAGIETTRYPADCSLGFQPDPSLSFFLYNDNGQFGIARPFLDGRKSKAELGEHSIPKYTSLGTFDNGTSCPSENATYEFGEYAWWTKDDWQEVLSVGPKGSVLGGSLEELWNAFRSGKEIKVAVKQLCDFLALQGEQAIEHEVFVCLGPIYAHRDQGFLGGESQPIVRVLPDTPLEYRSGNWNYGWILPRTDGVVHQLVIDPYTNKFNRIKGRHSIRWFVR